MTSTEQTAPIDALKLTKALFAKMTDMGWFDEIAADIHPDEINAACDAVDAALSNIPPATPA